MDAWCHGLEVGKCNSHGHYLDELKRKQAELNAIAEENVAHNLKKAREHCNKGRVSSYIRKGDTIMLRNDSKHDSLDPRYRGPYEVMDREGPNVQLHIQREVKDRNGRVSIRHGNKWVHLNRCKEYYSVQSFIYSTTTSQKLNESVHLNGLETVETPEVEDSVLNSADNLESLLDLDEEDVRSDSCDGIDESYHPMEEPRYPTRP